MCAHQFLFSIPGLECDAFDNPADFFLDKMNEAEEDLKPPNLESNILDCMCHDEHSMYCTCSVLHCVCDCIT